MAKYTRFINDDQWKLLKPLLPEPKTNPKGGRPTYQTIGKFWKAFYGSYAPALVAGSARSIPKPIDMLAAITALGRPGRLA